jgi:hypothetical protein
VWRTLLIAPLGSLLVLAFACVTLVLPIVGFGVACAAIFVWIAIIRPYWALLATFFLIPFEYLTVLVPADSYGSGGFLNHITLIKLMFAAIITAGLLRLTVMKDERIFQTVSLTPIPALLIAFISLCWLSLANTQRVPAFAVNMMSLGSGVVAFFILINLVSDRDRLYVFLKVVCVSYIFIALAGMFEAVTKTHLLKLLGRPMIERPWTENPDAFRICGPSGDPDYYAVSIIFGLMITFAVWPLLKHRLLKAGLLGVALLHFLAIVATASRGAALSTALALGIFYLFARIRHKVLIGTACVIVLGGAFAIFSLTISSRAAARYTGDTSSWEERLGWITMCYEMMMDAPVRGAGSGQFAPQYHRYMKTHSVPREAESAQNTYAQMAAQNGIPTTLVYLAANVILWFVLYRVFRGTRDPVLAHIAVSIFSLALSFFLFSLTLDLAETEVSWILFALGVILWRLFSKERADATVAAVA